MAYGLMGGIGTGLSGFEEAFSRAQGRQDTLSSQQKERAMMQAQIDAQNAEKQKQAQGLMATNAMLASLGQGGVQTLPPPPIGIANQTALKYGGQKVPALDLYGMSEAQQQALTGQSFAGADIGKFLTLQNSMKPKQQSMTGAFQNFKTLYPNASPQDIVRMVTDFTNSGKVVSQDLFEKPDGSFGYIPKGSSVPAGWKPSKSGGVNVTIGQDGKPVQTEKTRLITIAKSGSDAVTNANDLFFPNGEYDSSLAKILSSPDAVTASGAVGEKASQAYNAMYGAVQDKLRLESGAAIPPEEIKAGMRRYMPGPFDTKETAKVKIDSLMGTLDLYRKLGERGLDVKEVVGGGDSTAQPRKRYTFNAETGKVE